MKLTDALLGEHAVFYGLFDRIEEMASTEGLAVPIQSAMLILNSLVMSHAAIEEELLFPALVAKLGPGGEIEEMRSEHDELERALEQIEDTEQFNEAAELTLRALSLARAHFKKEEEELFHIALRTLDEEELTRLGAYWAASRNVTVG